VGEGAAKISLDAISSMPLPPQNILELKGWQSQRLFAIRSQSRCDRSCDAYVARVLGYHTGLPPAERKKKFKEAADMRASVEKKLKAQRRKDEKARGHAGLDNPQENTPRLDGEGHAPAENQFTDALSVCLPIILNSIRSREGWDQLRDTSEANMREIARSLPVWERVSDIVGFADLGLAVIVAEAGNELDAYPHHMHLWKRLGLAPYKDRAGSSWRGKGKGSLTKDEWADFGYNPVRRGTIAGDITLPLFFAKTGNVYGAIYTARRAHTALTHPDWTPLHSDNDARRIMTKALVKDVWRAWRESKSVGPM
jgi:hypothetical protein